MTVDYELVSKLKAELWHKVHDVVDDHLKNQDSEVAEEVRQQMTEQFRFWAR